MSDATGLDDAQLADSQIPSDADPFALFDLWFAKARENEINDPNAMALATANAAGAPSVRMVLLKGHGSDEGSDYGVQGGGFTFFTNMGSRKGTDLAENRAARLTPPNRSTSDLSRSIPACGSPHKNSILPSVNWP